MKILFVWTGVTSYMADCWRALQRLPGVELKIVVEQVASGSDFNASAVLRDLDCTLVQPQTSNLHCRSLPSTSTFFDPDIIFAGGWRSANTRMIVDAFPDVPKVFCLDMPWRWEVRCVLARFALWRFLRKFDRIYVPGELSARYARWLGFPWTRIEKKLYSVDFGKFDLNTEAQRRREGFVYLGRFAPEKRIDLLVKAYARYRELGGTWAFDLYGSGQIPQTSIYNFKTSTVDLCPRPRPIFHPFAQPDELTDVYLSHACLVMASSFDPWPLVIAESTAAGLAVIASDRCGNGEELGARTVKFGDVEAMAREMLKVEREWSEGRLHPPVGSASPYAASYDCKAWAKRTLEMAKGVSRSREEVDNGGHKIFGWCPGMNEPANGMAVVARLLARDEAFRDDFIVHGMWLPRGWWVCLRHFGNYVRMTHGSLSPLYLERQGKWKKRLVRPIERFLLRHARKVLATCAAEKEWILAYEPRARVKIVDIKRYFHFEQAVRTPLLPTSLHLLYLGRRHPLKGVEYLERAVEELNQTHQTSQTSQTFSLRLVSDATGVAKESQWEWCDVLVLPTLSENFGLVVAEALKRGKRVITTDGAPAWGEEGDAGRLVYLKGYRDGSDADRVRLLKTAIGGLSDVARA